MTTVLLSVTPPGLVASATAVGGETIRGNPKPSMGAGTVSPPADSLALYRADRAENDGVVVGGLLGSLAGGTIGIVGDRRNRIRPAHQRR